MPDKLMRFAVKAARVWIKPYDDDSRERMTDLAAGFQEEAEPLLAVVRDAVKGGWRCRICDGQGDGYPEKIGHGLDCPVPAALKAMEEANA